VHQTIVDLWSKVWAVVSSNHKPAIIPRDIFSTNHKTVQSSGGGQLFLDALYTTLAVHVYCTMCTLTFVNKTSLNETPAAVCFSFQDTFPLFMAFIIMLKSYYEWYTAKIVSSNSKKLQFFALATSASSNIRALLYLAAS
jgi:cellobiose-specific phosphotransferase system component IIC